MPSVAKDVRHERTGGMNWGVQPHQIPAEQWRTVFNMRPFYGNLTQVARKKTLFYPTPYSNKTLLHISNLGSSTGPATLVALTEHRVVRLEQFYSLRLQENNAEAVLVDDLGYRRWGTDLYNNRLYFVNELNPVRYTDGSKVYTIAGAPHGRFCQVFFDHLVVGGPIINGSDRYDSVAWSDLNNFGQFRPDSDTEADSYTFNEYQSDLNILPGVTGLMKLHNLCLVYTASAVYQMQYTGHPRIMRVDPLFPDIGCGLRYSLIKVGNFHFFADIVHKTFFMLGPDKFEDIGGPIRAYFVDSVNPDFEKMQRTWAYFDPRYSEIVWVYVSKDSSDEFDRAVVFNLRSKQWYACSVENVHSFCHYINGHARRIDDIQVQVDSITDQTIDQLAGATNGLMQVWGSKNMRLMIEEQGGENVSDLEYQPTPYLETGDLVGSSFGVYKEVDRLLPQTTFKSPVEGMIIQASSRDYKNDPVVWEDVNVFDPATAGHKRAHFIPKKHGRILRYRFMPKVTAQAVPYVVAKPGLPSFQMRVELTGDVTPPAPIYPENTDPALDGMTLFISGYAISALSETIPQLDAGPSIDDDQAAFWLTLMTQEMDNQGIPFAERYPCWYFIGYPATYYSFYDKYGTGDPTPAIEPLVDFSFTWQFAFAYRV